MATSNEDEKRRMINEAMNKHMQQKQNQSQMSMSQSTWSQVYLGQAGSNGTSGQNYTSASLSGFTNAQQWVADAAPEQIRIGPFDYTQYTNICSKHHSDYLEWERVASSTSPSNDYWLVINKNQKSKKEIQKEKGDYQEGYDAGYEDGLKAKP